MVLVTPSDWLVKVKSRTTSAHAVGKSDKSIGVKTQVNKGNQSVQADQKLEESVEQRGLTEGNTSGTSAAGTQSLDKASCGLARIRERAKKDKQLQFNALLHHIDVSLLRESFMQLKRNASAGVDGVHWRDYQQKLLENLNDLHSRVHRGSYRALPSKRARIAKESGGERLLGIASLEDKVVQQAVATVKAGAIRSKDAPGENPFAGVRSRGDHSSQTSRSGQTGNVQLPGLHSYRVEKPSRSIFYSTAHDSESPASKIARVKEGTEAPLQSTDPGDGVLAASGSAGVLPLLCGNEQLGFVG